MALRVKPCSNEPGGEDANPSYAAIATTRHYPRTEVTAAVGNSDAVRLTVSQRLGGIDPESPTGRSEYREQADYNHERRSGGEDTRDVPATHLFDRQIIADYERHYNAAARPDRDLAQRPSEDARQQASWSRPHGRPNPDLPPTLVDGEGHERVSAGCREEEDSQRHCHECESPQIVTQRLLAVDFIQREEIVRSQGRVQRRGDLPEPAGHAVRVGRAQCDAKRVDLSGHRGMIHRAYGFVRVEVRHDTDDLVPAPRLRSRQSRTICKTV